jgi:hypothetical protein
VHGLRQTQTRHDAFRCLQRRCRRDLLPSATRLAAPIDSVLITGAKRDIALLQRVDAQPGDAVTALDISVAVNRQSLLALLDRGVKIEYFDHHFAGELPKHAGLDAHLDASPGVCTGILVDRYLTGKQRIWAVVAAFGGNLAGPAQQLALSLALDSGRLADLRELGESLTYNAYGDCDADLIEHPSELYLSLLRSADPFRFIRNEPVFRQISEARRQDLEFAQQTKPEMALAGARVYMLPDAPWSRRVRGVFGNELANHSPELAHAILTPNAQGGYTVSVRAPLAKRMGADALCRQFATGGGRSTAAGIDHLPTDQLREFVRRLDQAFP